MKKTKKKKANKFSGFLETSKSLISLLILMGAGIVNATIMWVNVRDNTTEITNMKIQSEQFRLSHQDDDRSTDKRIDELEKDNAYQKGYREAFQLKNTPNEVK